MEEVLEVNDFEFIQKTAHMIKGAGGGYGLDTVSSIAASLESAAKNEHEHAVRVSLEKLAAYLEQVRLHYS